MSGRRIGQTYPDRSETSYTYSKAGQLTHVLNNNRNNNNGVPIHHKYSYNRLTNIDLKDIPSAGKYLSIGFWAYFRRKNTKILCWSFTFTRYKLMKSHAFLHVPYYYYLFFHVFHTYKKNPQ
ncbi:hypothetical protein HHL23_09195 [Chryseobacterium sp. RP-3-3]|uniref:YD repeat-containing protein n=1 Tax=Chryseobacterium antibioticum TaxID=2728847 RepID=A0A7Y0FS09_9FLAO|nr:hypothetical protein [Chryseobacterium antibioticum]NML69974.1 hypothetical protein [Chryseobacterium antibioticum]